MNPHDPKEILSHLSQFEQNTKRNLVREKLARDNEALKLYDPLPYQVRFHSCKAQKALIQKGNRTGGPQKTSEPVLTPTGWVPIGDLKIGDEVIGGDGKPCRVTGVFPQGWKAIFKVTFDDGAFTYCCEDHYWKCKLKKTERFPSHPNYRPDKWGVYSLHDIRLHGGDAPAARDRAAIPTAVCELPAKDVPVDPYTLGVLLGDGCIAHDSANFTCGDAEVAEHVASTVGANAEVKYHDYINYRIVAAVGTAKNGGRSVTNPIVAGLRELGLQGTKSETKFIPESYLLNSVDVRLETLRGLMDTDGYADQRGQTFFYTCSPQLAQDACNLARSLGGKSRISWKETFITTKRKSRGRPKHTHVERDLFKRRCLNMAVVWFRLPEGMCPFKLERKVERWKKYRHAFTGHRLLTNIEPAGNAECVCISVDNEDHTYVTRDYIVTHNTLANMVEVARAVTGQDPYGKYPARDGRAVVLGLGEDHIGRVFHKMLFCPGAFDIIRDKETRKWRTFRPWAPEVIIDGKPGDLDREMEKRKAPSLIPPRFIDGKIAWRSHANRVFSLVRFTTGWELYALNSAGDSGQAQGFNVNLYAIDEDLATTGWYEEAVGRIAACRGLLRWSALPHAKNHDLMTLTEQAEDEATKPNPTTVLIRASILDNPYQDHKGREDSIATWKAMGEDVYRKRVMGEIDFDSVLMYPTYNRRIHCVIRREGQPVTPVQQILIDRQGEPPNDWTRYMIVDPGNTVCAVLFIAVPPPEIGRQKVVYQEAYIHNATATIFGEALDLYARDKVFEKFIIDMHGGRLTSLGTGVQTIEYYVAELTSRRLKSEQTGMAFVAGCDQIKFREEALRNWLAIQRDGEPTILIFNERCPNLCSEMERFRKKTVKVGSKDVPTDEGNRRANTHAVECYDSQTEVLTRQGWKFFKDVSKSDELATVNLASDKIEYQHPTRLIDKPYSGEMIKFGGLKMDALVTPGHRMVINKDVGLEGRGPAVFRDAKDLNKWTDALKLNASWEGSEEGVIALPRTQMAGGKWYRPERYIDAGDFAEFLGWYTSEGCSETVIRMTSNGYRVTISQSAEANPAKCEMIDRLQSRLPWKWSRYGENYSCSDKQLWSYLKPLGDCYTKRVPDWIKNASPTLIARFLKTAVLGDGWIRSHGGRAYGTSSKQLADDIQELFIKAGRTASILVKPAEGHRTSIIRGNEVRPTADFYSVHEWSKPNAILRNSQGKPNFFPVQYEGRVYCATVPNGTLIVRRNGRPLICGNCLEMAAADGLEYVKPRSHAIQPAWVDQVLGEEAKRQRAQSRVAALFGSNHINLGPQGASVQ